MYYQYILEAKFLDKLNRTRRKTIIGVYRSIQDAEAAKTKVLADNTEYRVSFGLKEHWMLNFA
jgi:hypothetical protein